jgi:hypothetical protein
MAPNVSERAEEDPMKRIGSFLIIVLGVGVLGMPPASVDAQTRNQYVVKFVCGSSEGEEDASRVVPGRYATSINIFNASGADALFFKNVALTFPPVEQEPGAVSEVIVDQLPARAALQVDCGEIPSGFTFAGGAPISPYTEGFLVIESPGVLKVTGVYTATNATGGASVDVEEVEGSKVRVTPNGQGQKLTICHHPPGNPSNEHTLTIGAPAWPAHQAHGDTLGACPAE